MLLKNMGKSSQVNIELLVRNVLIKLRIWHRIGIVIITQPFVVNSGRDVNNECHPERFVLSKLSTQESIKLHQEMHFLLT